jgi:hypothetical protein
MKIKPGITQNQGSQDTKATLSLLPAQSPPAIIEDK